MFFLHSKNVGKEEFRVHKELNLRHSDLFSDEPHRLYREKVSGSYPPVDSDCFLCLTLLDKTENTIFFNSAGASFYVFTDSVRQAWFSNVKREAFLVSRTKVFFVSGMTRTDLQRQ